MPVQEDAQFGQIVVKGAYVAQVDGVLMKDIRHHVPDEGGNQGVTQGGTQGGNQRLSAEGPRAGSRTAQPQKPFDGK